MANPWLNIPLNDYEEHMRSAPVQQLDLLSQLFGNVLRHSQPASLAVLGVAGGNGLEQIDSTITRRVYGIDFNAAYLETVRQRFPSLPGLELYSIDLAEQTVDLPPVQLVHAALIFEHAGVDRALTNALQLVDAGGSLSVVLQLPSTLDENVGVNSRPVMQTLRPLFRLIDPVQLTEAVEASGFKLAQHGQHPLPSGKGFWTGLFTRRP